MVLTGRSREQLCLMVCSHLLMPPMTCAMRLAATLYHGGHAIWIERAMCIELCAVQALLQLERNQEAESKLLSIASGDDAPLELCTSALAAMLEVPGFSGTVSSAAALILKRQPGLAQLPVQLVELILSKADSKVRRKS